MAKKVTEEKKEEKEAVPDYSIVVGLRRSRIVEIVDEHARIQRQIKELEERLKELKKDGVRVLVKAGVKSVMVGNRKVTQIDGMSSKLSTEKLLENGVSMKVIERATVKTPWTSLKVTEEKEGGDGGE